MRRLTTWVVAGSQQDTTSGFPLADDMAGSGRGQNTVLADEELLDAVRSTNLGNQLDHLGVPETTVATNDEERAWKGSLVSYCHDGRQHSICVGA